MEIFWALIGFIVGALVAWWYFGRQSKEKLAKREAEFGTERENLRAVVEGEQNAHQKTKGLLSELEAKHAATSEQITSLGSDLTECRQQLDVERSEREKSKMRLSELEAKNVLAAKQAGALKSEVDAVHAQLERSKAVETGNDDKYSQLQSANKYLKTRLDKEQAWREDLERQLRQAKTERSKVGEEGQHRSADHQEVLRQRDEKIRELEAKLDRLQTQADDRRSGPASEPATETISTPVAYVSTGEPEDDLTKIKGIGPVLRGKLHQLDITSFKQIAEFTEADIERVNAVLDFPGRIEREEWVAQARMMMNK